MNLDVWVCPVCLSPLIPMGEGLRCSADGRTFPIREGLPVLLQPEEEPLLKDAEYFAAAWKRTTWAPMPHVLSRLPYIRGGAWKQKARSLDALLALLGPASGRVVVDVGAGSAWLSYRLTRAGFVCYATDISGDNAVGLGAAKAYDSTPFRFERAIATLTRWPLQDACVDIAICNATLHYLRDIRPAVAEAARVLRPGGTFIVMNEPVHRDRRSAERASNDFKERLAASGGKGRMMRDHHHFVASDLETVLHATFRTVRRHDPKYGLGFRATRRLKSFALRMELASFPIYVATDRLR